jgi:pyruvate dehydrogenase E2 component (dihydrolipoyllysine-residue acetyltransferase)
MQEFKLPDLGENVKEGTIINVLVKPGDVVAKDQPVVEVETDKAALEVPSSVGGKVREVRVKKGDVVKVGAVVLVLDAAAGKNGGGEAKPAPKTRAPAAEPTPKAAAPSAPPAAEAPARRAPAAEVAETRAAAAAASPAIEALSEPEASEAAAPAAAEDRASTLPPPSARRTAVAAAPSVRQFAREIGVDIYDVPSSEPGDRITIDDVKQHARALRRGGEGRGDGARLAAAPPLPDFERWGTVARAPMSSVRKKTAEHTSASWNAIPHVTIHDKADVTDAEALRNRYKKKAEDVGGKLTITALMLKITSSALKVFPKLNASVDMSRGEIVYKKYYHLGVAADTDRGLVVPVIRDVDKKNVIQLSVELSQMSEKARRGKLSLEEMQGGTFTLTNLGGLGTGYFTPIVNYPEVAILGLGRTRLEPVLVDGKFEPRLMLPLSLSFDHRLIDGADGARALRWIVEAAEKPLLMVLEG